jgi:hypothetical protein
VPQIVKRSFKTAGDVVTSLIARLRHRLGRGQAPASRTANEKEVIVQLNAKGLELAGEALDKARVHGLIRKGLPLDEDSPFADWSKIRNADIGPLCARPHVDELRARPRGEALPRRPHVNIVDRSIGVLVAQMTLFLSMLEQLLRRNGVLATKSGGYAEPENRATRLRSNCPQHPPHNEDNKSMHWLQPGHNSQL